MTKKKSKHNFFFENHLISCQSNLNGFTEEIYKEFDKKAKDLKLEQKINDLFEGKKVNKSEKRAATHVQLRDEIVTKENKKFGMSFGNKFSEWCNKTEKIIVLGIGGSYWGNRMLTIFMSNKLNHNIQIAKNVNELNKILDRDRITRIGGVTKVITNDAPHPVKIHFYVLSKSFTTAETLQCLKLAQKLSNGSFEFTAITSNKKEAKKYGIKNIITIDEGIGGRYSIWSKMSIPSFLSFTDPSLSSKEEKVEDSFNRMHTLTYIDFIKGGQLADKYLVDNSASYDSTGYFEFVKRLAYSDIWFHNHANRNTRAIFSYYDDLWALSHYFQQLEMESLGKPANPNSEYKKTGQVILSGFGQDAQHAYLQLFHQGTHKLCADIIAPTRTDYADVDIPYDNFNLWEYTSSLENINDADDDIVERAMKKDDRPSLIYAQAFTQHELLSTGAKKLKKVEKIKGDTPTNIFSLKSPEFSLPDIKLTELGFLIATWEHRVFITSVMLQINPFDQFGVNAGKIYTNKYLAEYD